MIFAQPLTNPLPTPFRRLLAESGLLNGEGEAMEQSSIPETSPADRL